MSKDGKKNKVLIKIRKLLIKILRYFLRNLEIQLRQIANQLLEKSNVSNCGTEFEDVENKEKKDLIEVTPIFTNQKLAPKVIFKIPITTNASLPFIHRFIMFKSVDEFSIIMFNSLYLLSKITVSFLDINSMCLLVYDGLSLSEHKRKKDRI